MVRAARAGEIGEARGYAWAKRIFPLQCYELEEKFESDFRITRDHVDSVLRAIDDGWRKKKLISFYDLEGPFGERASGLDRMDLVAVCRLAFLDRRFDDEVWKALTVAGSGPIESQGLADPFNLNDDITY